MPRKAYLFAFCLSIAGGCAVGAALSQWSCDSPVQLFLCLGLALVGATFKAQVPGMTGTISPSVVPVLYALGKMKWQEAIVIAAIAGMAQCMWRAKRRPSNLQIAFNGGNLALSSGVAYAVSHSVAAFAPLLLFLVASIVYQVLDTLAVSAILSLLEERPLRGLWRNCHLWSFPYILAGGAFAAIWARSGVPAGFATMTIGAILLYLMHTFYQEIVARTCPAS